MDDKEADMDEISDSNHDTLLQTELYQAWTRLLGKLSHDLIGDLAMMRQKNKILVGIIPSLLKGYQLAVEHNLMVSEVKEKHLHAMADLNHEPHIAGMIEQIHVLNAWCEALSLNSPESQNLSAEMCINEAINQY